MVITSRNIVYYFLEHGLITFDSVVNGDLIVSDTSRRNRNFKLIRRHDLSYFVKQIQNWEPQAISTLQREAACYHIAQTSGDFAPLARLMPKFVLYDPVRYLLIVELLPDAENLSEYHRRLGKFPLEVASLLGQVLGTYHRQAGLKPIYDNQNGIFPKTVPWILSIHQVPVEIGASEATFALSWVDSREMNLSVFGPDGIQHDASSIATLERRDQTYQLVRVAVPMPGNWTLLVRNNGSEKPAKYTVSAAVQSPLTLSVEIPKVGGEHLSVIARLRRGDMPWNAAKVMARITMPTQSPDRVLQKYKDQIINIPLPDVLQEQGLSEEQILQLKFSLFAWQNKEKVSNVFDRKQFEIELTHVGDGTWITETPIHAAGTVSLDVIASGDIDGCLWERHATQSVYIPEGILLLQKVQIEEIFIRRQHQKSYAIIGARINKMDNTPAIPEDGTEVTIVVTQGRRKAVSESLPYSKRGKYYFWKFKEPGFRSGRSIAIRVQATIDGGRVATKSKTVPF